MPELTATSWLLLAVAALLVGFAKTAIGGVAAISVALFAIVLPAKESTGALLPLLLVGDLVAVRTYRAHAHWPTLLRLMPAVVVGVVAGYLFVDRVDDVVMRRTIGGVLLALVAVHLAQRWRARSRARADAARATGRLRAGGYGVLAGFTTMVANAGGSVTSLYLLAARLGVLGFLGTTAWFFLVVNAFKLPFSLALGLVGTSSLAMDAVLVPAVLVGAGLGRVVIRRIDQSRFEGAVLAVTVLSGLNLLR